MPQSIVAINQYKKELCFFSFVCCDLVRKQTVISGRKVQVQEGKRRVEWCK